MSTPSRQYYKEVMQFVTSKEFKSLPQQAQNKIKQVAKETHSKLREAEDARQPVDERETRKARGVLTNALTDLYSGMASVGKSGASLAAWTADIAGAKDTAKTLDEAALSLGNVAERITPAADPESWVDFGAQSVAQNAPMLASAIIGGKALAGSKILGGLVGAGRTALGVPGLPAAASGLSPSAASFASTLGVYGIPGARQANVEADYELTGKLREGKPFAEVMMAVPYAWVENTMGIGASKFMGNAAATGTITSMLQKNAGKVSKALSKPLFELSNKSGVRGAVGAFARWIADNVVSEASEEVVQGIMEESMPFFADLPVEQAIAKSLERINSPEVAEKLALQAKGGGIVGAVLGGGRTAVQSAVTTREAKLAEQADAAAKAVTDKAYSIMHESKDYASMITGLKKLHAQTEDQSHKDRITALIVMAHRKFSQQAQAELVMPPQETQPNPIVESVVSGAGDVIAGQRDKLTGLSARLEVGLSNLYGQGSMADYLLYQKAKAEPPQRQQREEAEPYPGGEDGLDGARLIALNNMERVKPELQHVVYDPNAPENIQALPYQPDAVEGRRLPSGEEIKPGGVDDIITLKSGEPFRSPKAALAYQTKNSLKDSHDITPVRGGFVLMKKPAQQKARRVTTETPQPNAGKIAIVDKSGQVPGTKKLVAAGDASRIEKKLSQKPAAKTVTAKTFKTAKGSVYVIQEDGTTIRDKAYRPEHGKKEQGIQPKSDKTVFVDPEDSQRLALPADATTRIIDHGNGTLSIAVKNDDGKWGISPSARGIPFTDMPAVGKSPVELFKKDQVYGKDAYKKIHLGNKITETSFDQPTVKQPEPAAEQKLEAGKEREAKPTSDRRPVETIQKEIASIEAAKRKADQQQATPPGIKRERIAKLNKKLDPLYSELEAAKAARLKTVETDRKSIEPYKNATILRQSDIGDGYSFMAKIDDKYLMVSKNGDYNLIGNASNATKFVSRIEAESTVDTWNENQEWKAKQEQAALKPALEVFKGDDVQFQFPDGREERADIIDPKLVTRDGIPNQVYARLSANNASRYMPVSWIQKVVARSPMIANRLRLEAEEAARTAKQKPAESKQEPVRLEAWETPLPTTGKPAGKTSQETINATVDDAKAAITPDQKKAMAVGQDKFNLYVLPGTATSAGVVRFVPEGQKVPASWKQIDGFKDAYRLGNMTEAQTTDLLTRFAWRAPILQTEATSVKPGKIEDFGEKLGGAKKDKAQEALRDLSDDDLRKMPLSQIWPKSTIDEIEDTRAAAFATAARAEIPAKPRKSYALSKWVEKIKSIRDLISQFIENPRGAFQKAEANSALKDFTLKVLVLEELPRQFWGRIGKVNLWPNAYAYGEDGQKVPKPSFSIAIDGLNYSRDGKSITDIIEFAESKLQAEPANKINMQFEVRGTKAEGIYRINKKGDPLYRTLKFFPTAKEALDFVANNKGELVAAWEKVKERENVSETDVRRGENRIRSGEDYRKGKDITPEEFSEAFGFRGVEFGNWVSQGKNQKERQGMLNIAYDAFMDLAKIIGVPPKALSLNSTLGIGFGSRGSGRASAHYEPGGIIINLTKTKGAGSLAHEWFHALDNYFSRERGGEKKVLRFEGADEYRNQNYITHKPEPLYVGTKGIRAKMTFGELQARHAREPENEYYDPKNYMPDPSHPNGVRIEVEQAFGRLVKALNESPMTKRAEAIDKGSSRRYWSSTLERAARAFETFIIESLADNKQHNDYLANVASIEEFSRDPERYPYLLPAESAPVKQAFKELFQTVKTEQTDKGVKLYSVEYLVAKYAAKGMKQAAKVIRAGVQAFASGVNTFAQWAKSMLKQFGATIGKYLRELHADLQSLNKKLGRTGAVGLRSIAGKFQAKPAPKVKKERPVGVPKSFGIQPKDLKWVKDSPKKLRLVRDGKTVATLEQNEKKQWSWKGTRKGFLVLGRAKSVVKREVFDVIKKGERESEKYRKAEEKAKAKAEARKRKHDDYFSQPLKDKFDRPDKKLTAKEKWQNFLHKVDETLFDRWAREKRLIAGAVDAKGLDQIPESENFYQRHELLANRIAARTEDFKEKYADPIEKDLVENNISYTAINRFFRVMHAEERNNHIFKINPEFRQRAMEDPDNPEYAGSGIPTKEARAEIAKMKADGTFETFYKIGEKYWALNNKLLDAQVKYGILPADVRDTLKKKYQHYAPLKSMDDDATGLDWRALGRRSESSDQLAHTMKAIETTFSYGENNRMRQAFAKFAINNPNPALYEIKRAVKKPYFDKNSGEVKYRLDMEAGRKDILYVKNGGNDRVFLIKDPDLLASLTNKNAAEVGVIGRGLLFTNRWLGAVNTAFAPEFMVANLIRDIQTAGISLSAEQSSDMAAEVLLNIPKAIKAVAQYKMGERDADGELYKEFVMQGGKIGYRDVYGLQETASELEKRIADAQKGGAWFQSKELLKDLGGFVADCNDVIESGTRLSTYMVARKSGMSKQASAALAAGVTINFQKKGTLGQTINAFYLFGSASLGGTGRVISVTAKAAQTKSGRAIIAGAIAFGFITDVMNRMLGGIDPDDERSYYDKISASEKDMNYILMIPGTKGKYLKLPMPHGFNALPAMGRNLSAMMFGDQTLMQSVGNVAYTLASSFSPTGYDERGIGHTVMPTALGLPVDLMTNSKFTGNRIKPEQNPFGAKLPQSQLVNKNTNKLLVVLTQALNRIAGGDERTPSGIPGTDISAADLQHVIESLTGGAGKIVSRSVDLLWRVGAAEEIPVGNVPFVRRLIGEAGDYSVYDSFMDRRDQVKRFEDARRKEDAAWISDNRWLEVALRRYKVAEKTAKDIRNDSTLSDSEKRERVVLEQKRFNRDFDKIKAQYDKPGATIPVEPETKKNSRPGRPRPPKRPKRPRLPKLSRL
jgi:hypothetical protein